MDTVRKGLREGQIAKDTYERLSCATCGVDLKTINEPDEIGSIRTCPECGTRWRQLN